MDTTTPGARQMDISIGKKAPSTHSSEIKSAPGV